MSPLQIQTAISIVRQANRLLIKKFNTLGVRVMRFKKNEEIVTSVDVEINKFITKELLKKFPNDDIVSEEAKMINNPGEDVWYIDPLDGTTNFTYGLREFAVCLAKIEKNQIALGVIGLPLAGEIYWAKKNGAAHLNNQVIKISDKKPGAQHLIFVCDGHSPDSRKKFIEILKKTHVSKTRLRVFASAGIELTSVASGRADGAILPETNPWDVLPGVLLVRAAGGKTTNFKGEKWQLKDRALIASNGHIHRELLELVK